MARLRSRVGCGSLEDLNKRPEKTTLAKLYEEGFSDRTVDRFFRPFLGGVFLESELSTSSRKFEFVFRMFSQGDAAMPANGMGAIAVQLADNLPDTVQTNTRVVEVRPNLVRLEGGEESTASNVILACEAPVAARLLAEPPKTSHGVTCLYFSADSPPVKEPILVLNGEGQGPINNLCVPSQVVPGCAPIGKSLISVTVLGSTSSEQKTNLRDEVLSQLRSWYGSTVDSWEILKTFNIPYTLPRQDPHSQTPVSNPMNKRGIILCGDYLENASIQGAMVSGRRAAESVLGSQERGNTRSNVETWHQPIE